MSNPFNVNYIKKYSIIFCPHVGFISTYFHLVQSSHSCLVTWSTSDSRLDQVAYTMSINLFNNLSTLHSFRNFSVVITLTLIIYLFPVLNSTLVKPFSFMVCMLKTHSYLSVVSINVLPSDINLKRIKARW
jgi:nitrate reductase NapE component